MSQFDLSRSDPSVEHGIAHVAMPDLFPLDHRHVEQLRAVRSYEPKINGRRRLELNFQKLVAYIWELPVILIGCISKRPTNEPMQGSTAVSLLINTRIGELLSYECRKALEHHLYR